MADENGSLREAGAGGKTRAQAVVTIPSSAYFLKQVEEEEEVEALKVEVAAASDTESDTSSDDLSCGKADIDPSLLERVDEEKCRSIRKQYRQLIYTVQQNRDDIVNTASDSLTEALEEANVLFDAVSRTREAALDSQFLVLASDLESAARKPRRNHRRKVQKMEENGVMPTKLRKLDLSGNQEATEKEVERILGLLQTYFRKYPDTPVSYFEFVIDPNSFSRTVENIFYVSFIIRDGFARIRLDQDRLPILEPININLAGEGNDPSFHSRKQGVISLSLQDWKNIVAAFEISEAMITNSY